MTCVEKTPPTARHTPGPWDYDMDYIVAPDPNERHPDIYIADIANSDDEGRVASLEQQDANRRLIAAAPALLEALFDCVEYLECNRADAVSGVEAVGHQTSILLDAKRYRRNNLIS